MGGNGELTAALRAQYGERVRLRVCGLCIQDNAVLLLRHEGIGRKGYLWAPPGGGVEFGESCIQTLAREFGEETHLTIRVEEFLCVNEVIRPPLHAIELFYVVTRTGGQPQLGTDPEMGERPQILRELAFVPWETIRRGDPEHYHNLFRYLTGLDDLSPLRGQSLQII